MFGDDSYELRDEVLTRLDHHTSETEMLRHLLNPLSTEASMFVSRLYSLILWHIARIEATVDALYAPSASPLPPTDIDDDTFEAGSDGVVITALGNGSAPSS